MRRFLMAVVVLLAGTPSVADTPFYDGFDHLDPDTWLVQTYASPGRMKGHSGFYAPENVFVADGFLTIRMDQETTSDGSILSIGGLVRSDRAFGFGTYEFRARFASTSSNPMEEGDRLSGGTSSVFIYSDNAAAEIDIEIEGQHDVLHVVSWKGADNPNEHSPLTLDAPHSHEQFYTYRIEWSAEKIDVYREDQLVASHTDVVPTSPGHIHFNHWGTNSPWWGGMATIDAPRFMYVDYIRFTPAAP